MRISDWSSDVCSSDLRIVTLERQGRDIRDCFHQSDAIRVHLPHRADHLGMAGMADKDDVMALFDLAFGLPVDLAHQRAGGVEIEKLAAFGFCGDRRSEEHTSELQSLMRNSYAVFCLKKKKNK